MALISNGNGADIVFCGTVVHAASRTDVEIRENAVLGVKNGKVVFLDHADSLQRCLEKHEIDPECVRKLTNRQFLMPGLVDCHMHSCQLPIQGVGTDMGLMDWLNTYTFPTEARFKAHDFARDGHYKAVRRTLLNGTTAAAYYSTIHRDTTMLLCDAADELGQRALVGRVNIDMSAPDYYTETTEQSIADTVRFVNDVLERKSPLVTPVITPRFAVNCTEKLMKALAQIAQEQQVPIQTHLNECRGEIEAVSELHPGKPSYSHVYDDAGLLGPKTILAHCVHMTEEEIKLTKQRDCGLVHCACSNTTLRSGLMDLRKLLDSGMKLGLGTDVGGGYSPTILSAMRNSVDVSNIRAVLHGEQKYLEHHSEANGVKDGQNGVKGELNSVKDEYYPITMDDAFYLGTLGGSKVLGLNCGNFEVGREFDALVIDPEVKDSPLDLFSTDDRRTTFHKFLYTGDDRNMVEIYVQGKKVMDKTSS